MALSDETKALRKAARQAATAMERERRAAKAAEDARKAEEAEHAERFNRRSSRESVAKSIMGKDGTALTADEHRVAEARGLVGPVPAPEPRDPFDGAAASEWLGVPVATPKWSPLSHGKPDDVEPDSYVPSAAEAAARAAARRREEARWDEDAEEWVDPHRVDDDTLAELGIDSGTTSSWFPDFDRYDRYDRQAETVNGFFGGDDIDDRPEWERSDLE